MSSVIYLQQSSNKNLLINPAFAVIQKAANGTLLDSLALPTQSLGYEGGTNWFEAATGGTPAYTYDSANESFTLTGASGVNALYFGQRIESKDVVRVANKLATLTFSVELSNSLLTSVIWEVFRPTTSNDVHGTIASPTQTLIASGTFTVSSTLTRYSASFTLPALASRGLELRLRVGAQTSGTWAVARPQLEEGSAATAFNCGDYSIEIQRCQRYAQIVANGTLGTVSGVNMLTDQTFAVPMFSTPVKQVFLAGVSVSASIFAEYAIDNVSHKFIITPSVAGGYINDRQVLYSAHIP